MTKTKNKPIKHFHRSPYPYPHPYPYSYSYFNFWRWLWILFVIGGVIVAIVALVNSLSDGHWKKDDMTGNIISKSDNADVEIRNGNDFIFHDKILHSGINTAIEKLDNFIPIIPFLPNGDDFIFGDQQVVYTRLQAGLAIGFRLGSQATFPLLFEPGLQVLIQPFGVHISSPFFSPIGTFVASDERVKKNISNMDIKEGILNVIKLQPKTYYYVDEFYEALGLNSDDGLSQEQKPKRRGFISQQVETILPNSVRETIFNLVETGPMEDFKDLRKEDLIVEIVSSIHYIIYQYIIDIVNSMDVNINQSPFEEYVDQFPEWAISMRNCVIQQQVDKNIKEKALCTCKEWKEICVNHPNIGLCNQNHPLREKCNLIIE